MSAPRPEHGSQTRGIAEDAEESAMRLDSGTTLSTDHKASLRRYSNLSEGPYGFLAAPQDRPLRPSSPSTLSILSAEELDELNPRRPSTAHAVDFESKRPAEEAEEGRFQRLWTKHKGVTWALIAQLFGAMMNMAAQELETRGNDGKGLDAFEILFVRMGITVFFSCLYMWHQRTPDFPFGPRGCRLLLIGRALGGLVGVWAMYFSLKYLPVQLAVVITFLAPFLTNYACSKIYGEPFTKTDVITGIISLFGVVLLAHPETLVSSLFGSGSGSSEGDVPPASGSGDMAPGEDSPHGQLSATPAEQGMAVGVALLGVLGSAVAYTTIRVIGKRAHPLISVNYFGTCCFLVSAITLAIKHHVTLPTAGRDWSLLLFLGVCGFTMQFLLAKGLAHEKSAKATNMQFSQMLFAMVGDKIIFGYTPGVKALIGSGLIICGVVFMVVQKAPAEKGKEGGDAVGGSSGIGGIRAGREDEDEESRMGLLSPTAIRDMETGEDHDRISMEEARRSRDVNGSPRETG